jgi:hypothetical protein
MMGANGMAAEETTPRVRILKDDDQVYIEINGSETPLEPHLAKEIGEALFKAGCDVIYSKSE